MRLILCLAVALSACATPAVRCGKHLQPINAPSPKTPAAGPAGKSP
jgi:hypothetical protein